MLVEHVTGNLRDISGGLPGWARGRAGFLAVVASVLLAGLAGFFARGLGCWWNKAASRSARRYAVVLGK